jgi:hypothetical protein
LFSAIFTQKHSQLIYKFIFFSLHLTKIDTEYNKITPYINDQLHFLNKEIIVCPFSFGHYIVFPLIQLCNYQCILYNVLSLYESVDWDVQNFSNWKTIIHTVSDCTICTQEVH